MDVQKFQLKYKQNYIILGPSFCGKTTLVFQFLRHLDKLCYPPPRKIYYIYSYWQDLFDGLKDKVCFLKSFMDFNVDLHEQSVLICDDLQYRTENDPNIRHSMVELFTATTHHKNLITICLLQNIFNQKNNLCRFLSLNCGTIIVFRNKRDFNNNFRLATQIMTLSFAKEFRKMELQSHKKYDYIVFDISSDIPYPFILRKNILPFERETVYIPNV